MVSLQLQNYRSRRVASSKLNPVRSQSVCFSSPEVFGIETNGLVPLLYLVNKKRKCNRQMIPHSRRKGKECCTMRTNLAAFYNVTVEK
jgi:hypothetical protein